MLSWVKDLWGAFSWICSGWWSVLSSKNWARLKLSLKSDLASDLIEALILGSFEGEIGGEIGILKVFFTEFELGDKTCILVYFLTVSIN